MEVDCSFGDSVTQPCTPQNMFDPCQPSTSGMATPSSVQSTPRMMTSSTAASTPIIIKYNENGVENGVTGSIGGGGMDMSMEQTPTRYGPSTPMRPMNYPSTPQRPLSRMSSTGSPFRPQSQNPVANERVHQLRESAIAKQHYMQQWIGQGYNAAAAAPSPQQRPPSMIGSTMSTMSYMSDASRFSTGGMSTLSVNTEIANYSWPQNPHQAPHILSKVASGENQDPTKMRRRMSLSEIVYSLKSNDAMKQTMALRELIPLAEQSQLDLIIQRPDLKTLIYSLFEILIPKDNENEKVVEMTLYLLYRVILYPSKARICVKILESLNLEVMGRKAPDRIEEMGYLVNELSFKHHIGILFLIMYRASRVESRYITKAWVLLAHLLCNTFFKRRFFTGRSARSEDFNIRAEVIRFAVDSLKNKEKPKPRAFAVSVIRNLSASNHEIMGMAMQLDVVDTFLTIMKEETIHEDLLWSTTQALSAFFAMPANGEHFIRLKGAQVLCDLLSHGSSRLLHELLGCMAKIADLPAIQEQPMAEPIQSVIRLLGSFDPTIVERATAILMNIGLHNKANKTILVQCGVTNHVFSVLRLSEQYKQLATTPEHADAIRAQLPNIYEYCLRVLANVTVMSSQDNRETAIEACKMISANVESATILLNFIGIGKRYLRKLAITILKRVIETIPSYAERFVDLVSTGNEQLHILLLKRIYESMKKWRGVNKELMQNFNNAEAEEKRKDHEDIVRRAAGLLTTLCLESNSRFMEEIKKIMVTGGANPFIFLSHEISDPMLFDWLSFIWKICNTPESLKQKLLLNLMRSSNYLSANLQSPFFAELHERRPTPQIRQIIMSIMQLAEQQYRSN